MRIWLVLLMVAAVVAVGFFAAVREPATDVDSVPSPASTPTPAQTTPAAEVEDRGATVVTPPSATSEPAAVRAARDELARAIDALAAAEAALAASEKELIEFERLVADIEARGEDPADYAPEVMDEVQPAFFRFQDAMAAVEAAESAEQAARNDLTRALEAASSE